MDKPPKTLNMKDEEIARAILHKDSEVTFDYLFKQCRPLFRAIFDRYYTDCERWEELATEIYVYIMAPGKKTGICKLAAFQFRCTLTEWLKIVSENYCHHLYVKKLDLVGENVGDSDIFNRIEHSLGFDISSLNMLDLKTVIALMPNQRYRTLIEHRYVCGRSNEETAALMSMTMPNYYNKHKLAKAQFVAALRKEGLV
jgi:DNA-directed RNA polymerase specialized sigma24 family protein